MGDIRTGAMGWTYEDWRGPFYEDGLPSSKMLEQYARVFSTIEVDSSFYGTPRATTLAGWARQVPADFLFSAKVPRAISHERRLLLAAESALDFGSLLQSELGAKLGALLVQLPPDFGAESLDTVKRFADGISDPRRSRLPWVIEFRNESWIGSGVLEWLTERGIACATSERIDLGGPLRYVRLLGIENSVQRFDERQIDRSDDLRAWAERLAAARESPDAADPIFVYIRNFFEGHSPASIQFLRERLGLPITTPPGQQQMSLF